QTVQVENPGDLCRPDLWLEYRVAAEDLDAGNEVLVNEHLLNWSFGGCLFARVECSVALEIQVEKIFVAKYRVIAFAFILVEGIERIAFDKRKVIGNAAVVSFEPRPSEPPSVWHRDELLAYLVIFIMHGFWTGGAKRLQVRKRVFEGGFALFTGLVVLCIATFFIASFVVALFRIGCRLTCGRTGRSRSRIAFAYGWLLAVLRTGGGRISGAVFFILS